VVFLLLFGFQLALFGVLVLLTERGTARRWSWTELAVLAVCGPLLVLGWTVLDGGWATAARAVGLVGLWLLMYSRFSQLLMGTATGDHTIPGVLAEIEELYAAGGDHEAAAVVRDRRERLAGARTEQETAAALVAIEGLAEPGNGRFSDRFTASDAGNHRLSALWPVLRALAARQGPRARI
jgi:hypothetical protein